MTDAITITIERTAYQAERASDQRDVLCLGQLLCTSDTPVFAAARILYNRGVDPETILVAKIKNHPDQRFVVGEAAELNNKLHARPEPRPYRRFLARLERPGRG